MRNEEAYLNPPDGLTPKKIKRVKQRMEKDEPKEKLDQGDYASLIVMIRVAQGVLKGIHETLGDYPFEDPKKKPTEEQNKSYEDTLEVFENMAQKIIRVAGFDPEKCTDAETIVKIAGIKNESKH